LQFFVLWVDWQKPVLWRRRLQKVAEMRGVRRNDVS
jgi:hypothetical protein